MREEHLVFWHIITYYFVPMPRPFGIAVSSYLLVPSNTSGEFQSFPNMCEFFSTQNATTFLNSSFSGVEMILYQRCTWVVELVHIHCSILRSYINSKLLLHASGVNNLIADVLMGLQVMHTSRCYVLPRGPCNVMLVGEIVCLETGHLIGRGWQSRCGKARPVHTYTQNTHSEMSLV